MASRSIIVTGANKGIGKALVERLLKEAPEFGTIVMTSRNLDLGNQTKL